MKKFALAVAALSLCSASSAFAQETLGQKQEPLSLKDGWYVEALSGVSLGEMTLESNSSDFNADETSFIGRVAVGKSISENLRVGLEGSYSPAYSESYNSNGVSVDEEMDVWSILAVAYYDFQNKTRFTPFVGGGVGIGIIDTKFTASNGSAKASLSDTTTHAALKLAAGVSFDLHENVKVVADYSLNYLHDAEAFDSVDITGIQNTFNLGLRYTF
ncbi:outer membrane protein [Flexibacterium corallicola]|uniref:outer membrane protein n=1 Tax=Flexibacterium corallicola TaxID=3037259 RepID=UPI00286EBCFF|nr:outer membrane beta-barrel protein [Pseudovibrio sp. M1P-2-3]